MAIALGIFLWIGVVLLWSFWVMFGLGIVFGLFGGSLCANDG